MKVNSPRAQPAENTLQLHVRRDVSGSVGIAVSAPVPVAAPVAARDDSGRTGERSEMRVRPKRRRRAPGRQVRAPSPVILFLAANPRDMDPLALTRECAEIQRELARVTAGGTLRFEARWTVSVDDAMHHMTELDPVIVHLSGHGGTGAAVVLEDDRGDRQPVTARALAMMILAAGRHARAVVVNACFGLTDVAALRAVVDCVIGCDGPIGDAAARAFAVRFYAALAAGRSIGNAVAQGTATLVARQLADSVLPRCVTRDGVDADAILLVRRGPARNRSRRR